MSSEKERSALKWTIGIIASLLWWAVARFVILSDGAGFDHVEQEWIMSTGQSWAMFIWTIVVVVGSVKIYSAIVKD